MKKDEKPGKKYFAVMLLCFIYGGFSLILFLFQVYSFFWLAEMNGPDFTPSQFDANRFDANRALGRAGGFNRNPFSLLTSPMNISYLFGGLISIIAGLTILHLIREKEIKKVKEQTANNLLLPEEIKVIEALKNAGYELTQSKLVRETGLSKVQVHRAVKKLEAKGVLKKHGYGLTNKIILDKEVFE